MEKVLQPSPAQAGAQLYVLSSNMLFFPCQSHSQIGGPLFFLKGKFLDTRPIALFQNVIISQLFWSLDSLSNNDGLLLPPTWTELASH